MGSSSPEFQTGLSQPLLKMSGIEFGIFFNAAQGMLGSMTRVKHYPCSIQLVTQQMKCTHSCFCCLHGTTQTKVGCIWLGGIQILQVCPVGGLWPNAVYHNANWRLHSPFSSVLDQWRGQWWHRSADILCLLWPPDQPQGCPAPHGAVLCQGMLPHLFSEAMTPDFRCL